MYGVVERQATGCAAGHAVDEDLQRFFTALAQMFERDRSAARGQMAMRGLCVFRHDSEFGNAHTHALLDLLVVKRGTEVEVPRDVGGYSVLLDGRRVAVGEGLRAAPGATLIRRC